MYLGYQNGKIKFYTEEPLDVSIYNLDEVIETQDEYVLDGEEYVLKDSNYDNKQAELRREEFLKQFFYIENFGYYRKQPKGYTSALESINTAFNAVNLLGTLPAGYLIFYAEPDFTKEEQLTEEWLVANQIKNEEMTKEEFAQFYSTFITSWNTQEHL